MKRWSVGFAALVVLGSVTRVEAATWSARQLTDNDYEDETPRVSGSNVVWTGYDGNDREIYVYNGKTTRQLTDNDYDDGGPEVWGSNVVWMGKDREIFFYNGMTIRQLTDNTYSVLPQVYASNVVWQGFDGNDWEVFLYDGTDVKQLTDNDYFDFYAQIDGSNVVWCGNDRVLLYDGTSIRQLSDSSSYGNQDVQISGSYVVWEGSDGDDEEILLYDGTGPRNLSNNDRTMLSDGTDTLPDVSGSNVVWAGMREVPQAGLSGYHVSLYDGTATRILSLATGYTGFRPKVSGSNVVWEAWDGHDEEVLVWDGSSAVRLTDNDYTDRYPQISGSNIVWQGWDGQDWEIFQATVIPEPSTFISCLLAALAITLGWWRRSRAA